jgi:hypothetical protein
MKIYIFLNAKESMQNRNMRYEADFVLRSEVPYFHPWSVEWADFVFRSKITYF